MKLLTREQFKEQVFARDGGKCVFCDLPAVDAHHILDRALWDDGGYYLDNGASVCAEHHLDCERTIYSVEEVREACGITNAVHPPHLTNDTSYDKWGNPILPDGWRLRGDLFRTDGCQKMLREGGALDKFVHYRKYPRTPHLPWSPGCDEDDIVMEDMDRLEGQRVIITEKMDGENTTMYYDHIHARSMNSASHPTRHWVKTFWGAIQSDIPSGWRVCGENLYGQHSIRYDDLFSYFYGFGVWKGYTCLAWDETVEWFDLWGIYHVPVLYDGPYCMEVFDQLNASLDLEKQEGYVVRIADSFTDDQFRKCVGKYVRKGHVTTDDHWMHGEVVPNGLLD